MPKIVVTGYGMKAPGVSNKEEFKDILEKGTITQELVERIGPNDSDLVCGVVNSDLNVIGGKNYKNYPRVAKLAIAAADSAFAMSGLQGREHLRIAVIMGTSIGGLLEIEKYAEFSNSRQYKKFPLSGAGAGNAQSLSTAVAYHLGAKGLVFTVSTGCTAGVDAILMAKMILESNQADVCIAGGSDAPLTTGCIYSFTKLGALAKATDVDQAGSPFSLDQEGFVLSEGAGVLVLEREEDALSRGTNIYGTLENVHSKNDGMSIFESDKSGKTMTETLHVTLEGKTPTYISSQALGLRVNDSVDYKAYKQLFNKPVPVTSIKGAIGHAFGASGVIQSIAALLSFEYNFISPTVKSTGSGFEDMPIVFETAYRPIDRVAVTTHGYGGNNTCLLFAKYA